MQEGIYASLGKERVWGGEWYRLFQHTRNTALNSSSYRAKAGLAYQN